jgi:conjugative relaxase-like TrwC/TraI family protein
VLSVAKVRRGHEAYYLEATAQRVSGRPGLVESDGTWWGGLAGALGLADLTVEVASYLTLLSGMDPTTLAPLDPRHHRVTVTAFDCTFAAPKSVSLLHALGPADAVAEVRRSHEQAVAGALGYLERHAAAVRRAGTPRRVEGFVAAAFLHRTSRADDPHLHTHLVVANLAPDASGRWSALDARPLYAHASAAGALYRAQLRHEISRRLSVAWRARLDGFADLIGITAAALRGFSRRSAEIAAELDRTGWSGPHAARFAADRTRPEKGLGGDYETLVATWRERAFALGVSRSAVARLGARRTPATERVELDDVGLEERVAAAAQSLGRPFDRRELVRATCARLADGAPAGRLEAAVDALLASGELVPQGARAVQLRAAGGGRIPGGLVEARFATPEIATLGQRLAGAMAAAPDLGAATDDAGSAGGERSWRPGVIVAGKAGDPCSVYTALREAAVAAARLGRPVVGLAPDRRGAAHLEAATGIATTAFGVREAPARGSFVVVAHPDRCPLRAVVPLVDGACATDATVVLVGCDLRAGRTPAPIAPHPAIALGVAVQPGEALTRHTVGGVEVVIGADLIAALGAIGLLAEESQQKGRRSLVVAAEPRVFGSLAVEVVRPSEAFRRQRAGDLDLIVFGGARLLGPGIAHLPDGVRHHVAVAPVERGLAGERSFALELAEPAELRRTLGRPPEGRRAREAWRIRAEKTERRGRTCHFGLGLGGEEDGWARGCRVYDTSRRREVSLSR